MTTAMAQTPASQQLTSLQIAEKAQVPAEILMAEMVARAKELAAGATGNPDLHYDTLLTELQEALDTAEAYEAENTALRMTLKRLASENAYLRADNKTLTAQLRAKEHQIDDLSAQADTAKLSKDIAEQDCKDMSAKLREVEACAAKLTSDLSATLSALRALLDTSCEGCTDVPALVAEWKQQSAALLSDAGLPVAAESWCIGTATEAKAGQKEECKPRVRGYVSESHAVNGELAQQMIAESEDAMTCDSAESQARAMHLPTNLATCAITCKLPCITEQEEPHQPTPLPRAAEQPDTQIETTSHSDKDTTTAAHAADATDAIAFGACGTESESDHVASSSPSHSRDVSACAEVRVKVCVPEAKAPVVSPPSPTKSRRGWRVLFSCILPQRDE